MAGAQDSVTGRQRGKQIMGLFSTCTVQYVERGAQGQWGQRTG